MRNSFRLFSAAALFALCVATVASVRADEGIARITELGDRDLVAQSKKKSKPKEPVFKSVEDKDETSGTYFKGAPVPLTNDIYLGAGLDYWSAFGLQARFATRLLDKGLIPDITNSLYLEAGLGMTFYGTQGGTSGVTGFNFLATGRWDFQMDVSWIFFADLGFGYNAISAGQSGSVRGGGLFPAVGAGAIYNFGGSEWAARGDFSYQFLGAGLVRRF